MPPHRGTKYRDHLSTKHRPWAGNQRREREYQELYSSSYLTNLGYKRKTMHRLHMDGDALPDDWTLTEGVLVGMWPMNGIG